MPQTAIVGRLIFSLSLVLPACAGTISIGFLSHETAVPIEGQNTITLQNFTGLVFGCTADFESCTDLTITGSLDMQFESGPTVTVDIVDAGPGTTVLYSYSASNPLVAAALMATASFGELTLYNGNRFTPVPIVISGLLSPDPGISVLTLDGEVATPEPSTGLLMMAGWGALAMLPRKRRRG